MFGGRSCRAPNFIAPSAFKVPNFITLPILLLLYHTEAHSVNTFQCLLYYQSGSRLGWCCGCLTPLKGVKNNYNAAPYVAGLVVAWCCISNATRSTRVGSGLMHMCCISSCLAYNTLPNTLPVLHDATRIAPRRIDTGICGVASCCISVCNNGTRSCCILYYQWNYQFYVSRTRVRICTRVWYKGT